MKWLSAGLTFVNLSVVCGLLLGTAGHGLNALRAALALVCGVAFAVAALLGTSDPGKKSSSEASLSKPTWRYGKIWFWLVVAFFALFAVRSFCWLLYIDGGDLKIQSPNNLGDLSLHIAMIRNFANGVQVWPDSPIYAFSKLRYPAGIDLFNALLCLVHVDLIRGLLVLLWHWREKYFRETPMAPTRRDSSAQEVSSSEAATNAEAKAGDSEAQPPVAADDAGPATAVSTHSNRKGPLPFWVEVSLYASMPLFHVHTFIALTIVLLVALLFERVAWPKIFSDAPIRRHAIALFSAALIPATFFVWLVTDQFHAKSLVKWHPGWVQDSADFGAPFFRLGGTANFGSATGFGSLLQKTWNGVIAPFFQFWLTNFGLWVLLTLALVGLCGWRVWKAGWRWGSKPPADMAFVLSAVVIFAIGYFVQTAPWDWDNLKLMVWGYFLILPFLWSDLIGRWAFPERAITCIALFTSGFVTLLGGLTAGHPGFGLIDRARLDAIGTAVRPLPVEARFAAYPTYNHPLLLQGRKVVLGYPGHLWTEGFEYDNPNKQLTALMRGAPNWRQAAQALGVRYIFWGRDETANYQGSTRPWETTARRIASGDWGAIYDLTPESPSR